MTLTKSAKMKKITFFKKIRFLIEYILLHIIRLILVLIPYNMAIELGASLGRMAAKIITKRFRLTVDNIQKAFPEKSQKESQTIALKSWENMAMVTVEFAKATCTSKEGMLKKCKFENTKEITKHLQSGKGVLVHLGHFTNWEIIFQTPPLPNFKTAAIARHIRNPYIDKWITSLRQRFGMEIISHRNPFFSCVKKLKKGYMVGIAMDQNMPANAIFSPFLGRMCATTPLTALLALKMQTPVFPLKVTRNPDGVIKAVFEKPIFPDKTYSEENVKNMVNVLNRKLEDWIKQAPHLWLWAHNRWKREHDAPKKGTSDE